jgi:hypothetical protein
MRHEEHVIYHGEQPYRIAGEIVIANLAELGDFWRTREDILVLSSSHPQRLSLCIVRGQMPVLANPASE